MTKYVCNICSYAYDPEESDHSAGVEPGTEFEDLPDDWAYPECGAIKEE